VNFISELSIVVNLSYEFQNYTPLPFH